MHEFTIPEPFIFNPLKHYLPFIKEFINSKIRDSLYHNINTKDFLSELKHLGTSVMDIYTGALPLERILCELKDFLSEKKLHLKSLFALWAGTGFNNYKIISLSDTSQWTLKYHENDIRFVHIFPARQSPFSFRIKANTLKSAILYLVIIGKDYVTEDGLNQARALIGLSPVKDLAETEAVTEMIDILRI